MQQANKLTVLCNPFLGNRLVNTPLQQQLLLETVFSTWSVQSGYEEENWGNQFQLS
jgi:hypothetical protein